MGIPEELLEAVEAHSMVRPGERVVVALSGGGDSVALLRAMHDLVRSGRLEAGLSAAHLNHCLRSEDSEADEAFCRALADALGVELVCGREDVRRLAEERSVGIEEAARDSRMDFLIEAAGSLGARKIAFGHTLDDQAETVLFRAIRGTGLAGLGAMRPVQEWEGGPALIRPMLGLRRDELRAYLRSLGQAWREDATNLDTVYSRNAVRLAVLPGAEKINRRAAEALARLAELSRRAADHLIGEADAALAGPMSEDDGGGVSCRAEALAAMAPAVREFALRRLVERAAGSTVDLGLDSVGRLMDLVEGGTGRKVELPGGAVAERSYDTVTVYAVAPPLPPAEREAWSVELSVPGTARLRSGGAIAAELLPADEARDRISGEGGGGGDSSEHLDYDAIGAPTALTVRSRHPGDRFTPLGMSGTKKVKDLLIDERVPQRERSSAAVVLSAGSIIWVAPYRLDDSAKVTESTARVLRLRLTRAE